MEYARAHMPPKLFGGLRSVKGLWNAVCGDKVSSTNGLLAQYAEHKRHPKECGICLKKIRGVFCARCGKNWVELDINNKPTEFCAQCLKIPSSDTQRRQAARMSMTGNSDAVHGQSEAEGSDSRRWYLAHRVGVIDRVKAWKKANPEKQKAHVEIPERNKEKFAARVREDRRLRKINREHDERMTLPFTITVV